MYDNQIHKNTKGTRSIINLKKSKVPIFLSSKMEDVNILVTLPYLMMMLI